MLLEALDVTKAFGSFKAVDAATVTLEQGDILGLIGPNGAGKSTLFNCLTGDLLSTSGKVRFEGTTKMDGPAVASEVQLGYNISTGSGMGGFSPVTIGDGERNRFNGLLEAVETARLK